MFFRLRFFGELFLGWGALLASPLSERSLSGKESLTRVLMPFLPVVGRQSGWSAKAGGEVGSGSGKQAGKGRDARSREKVIGFVLSHVSRLSTDP